MPNAIVGTARLSTAALIVTFLAGSVAGCRTASETRVPGEPGAAKCPETFLEQSPPRATSGDHENLAPVGAVDALLCVYPFGSQGPAGTYRLGQTVPLEAGERTRLVDYLNALAGPDPTAARGCTLMGHDQYQVVLGYPDDTHRLVRINYNCGIASSAGAVRQLDRIDSLLAFWHRH